MFWDEKIYVFCNFSGSPNKDANVFLSIPALNSSETSHQSPIRYIDSISDEDEEVIGIITLEDVMEELIQVIYNMLSLQMLVI
jgi:metal transporter CNNM